jgi:hypothetical protein
MSLCDGPTSSRLPQRACRPVAVKSQSRERAPRYEDALIREQMEYYRVRAPEYDVTSAPPIDQLAAHARRIEMGLDQFRPTGRVLEIASGTGLWTIHLPVTPRASRRWTPYPRCTNCHDSRPAGILESTTFWPMCSRGIPTDATKSCSSPTGFSHVPPGSFHRFWATVRAALAPAGRVFFVDELDDAWKPGHPFRETFANDPSVPVVYRSVSDGRTFRVVKIYWNTEKLRSTLAALDGKLISTPRGRSSGPRLSQWTDTIAARLGTARRVGGRATLNV